jgi:outer membrane beta-barrel protein
MEVRICIFLLARVRGFVHLLIALSLFIFVASANAAEEKSGQDRASEQQSSDAPLADDQLLTPKVKRKKIKVGKIDTEDLELGVFGGMYSIEDFGTNPVVGARFAYHVTEVFFVEATYGQTKGDRPLIDELLGAQTLTEQDLELTYYDIILGFNFLPGEGFIGEKWAFVTSLYFMAGAGNTTFLSEDRFTITGGFGYRFLATDWLAAHIDFRDHVFKTDYFGNEKTTNNLEMHMGFTIFF